MAYFAQQPQNDIIKNTMPMIVDYGCGNIGSIRNMLRKLGAKTSIGSTEDQIAKAEMIILPGVGSFDSGMTNLRDKGLIDILNQRVLEDKVPVLGICLGAQLMTNSSEEGQMAGLGWFQAKTLRMNFDSYQKKWPRPNIGWRDVSSKNGYRILDGIPGTPRFYFVHSYFLAPEDSALVSLESTYAFKFACGLHKENIHCVQFHPEKSHTFGMQLFRNFLRDYRK